jgi:hypothetical protein
MKLMGIQRPWHIDHANPTLEVHQLVRLDAGMEQMKHHLLGKEFYLPQCVERPFRSSDLYGELVSLMAEDGIEWTDEIHHAAPSSPPSPTTSSGYSLVYAPEQ